MTSEVNLVFINHMDSARMQNIISAADILVTRSGYSTIMDLASLGRSSLLVPTPGQTEQEYLALYLSSKGWFTACTQQKLGQGIEMKGGKTPDPRVINEKSAVLLHKALIELLDQ
jgi:UDP-N-acetylglucosamine:LPS N-acetylglucosamine transferase